MFDDLVLRPALFMATWAAGMSAATAAIVRWKVVGPGFVWTAGGASLLVGVWAVLGGYFGVLGTALLMAAALLAKRPEAAFWLFLAASLAYLVAASLEAGPLLVVTGAVALGGVSAEMLLGHWYLVDPKLPRSALRRLAGAGIVGTAADAVLLASLGAVGGLLGVAYVALAGLGLLLMVGVWFSIKEPGYSGVMAATGLSYLAVLTVLGSAALGRALLAL